MAVNSLEDLSFAVVDFSNRRVLIWSAFPTTNGQAADLVLGQPNFTSAGGGVGPASFDSPYDVCSNGIELFVADVLLGEVQWRTEGNTFYTEYGDLLQVTAMLAALAALVVRRWERKRDYVFADLGGRPAG